MTDLERLWEHPAVAVKHVITMSREAADGTTRCVANCRCGWRFAAELEKDGPRRRDEALNAHWRDVISRAEAGVT